MHTVNKKGEPLTFIIKAMDTIRNDYPAIRILLRGDSGFATPDLYKQCEKNGTISNISKLNVQLEQQLLTNLDSLTIALNSAIGTLCPFDGEIERCYDCTDQFLISWYSYQFRYCFMNNSGYLHILNKLAFWWAYLEYVSIKTLKI